MGHRRLTAVYEYLAQLKHLFDVNRYWRWFVGGIAFLLRYAPFVVAVVAGVLWTTFVTENGIVLTQDSCFYLKTAAAMHFDGNYNTLVTVWPPVYPFLVHLFMYITPWPAQAASLLSGVFSLAHLLAFAFLLRVILGQPFLELFFMLLLISIQGFWMVYELSSSENAFGFFVTANALFVYLHHQRSALRWLILAAVSASLAAMTRYSGAALLIALFFYGLYRVAQQPAWRRRVAGLALIGGAFLPNILWSLRNYGIDQTLSGSRVARDSSFAINLDALFTLLDRSIPAPFFLLLVVAIVFYVYRLYTDVARPGRGRDGRRVAFESYLYLFLTIYAMTLVYFASTTNINRISTRFLAPLYGILFAAAAAGLNEMLSLERLKRAASVLAFAIALALAYGASGNIKKTTDYFARLGRINKAQDAHLTFGFEKNKNGKQMAQYIDKLFANTDTVLMSGLYNMRYQRHHNMVSFFFREAPFGSDADDVEIHNNVEPKMSHSVRYLFQKSEVVLSYKKGGRSRKIIFDNPDKSRTTRQIVTSLNQIIKRRKASELYFIYVHPVRRRARSNFDAELKRFTLPADLTLAGSKKIANVTFYHFKSLSRR